MTNTVTIKFRAKRDEHFDFESMTRKAGFKVPTLTHSHVTFAQRDAKAQIITQGMGNAERTLAALAKVTGAKVPAVVFEDDAAWTVAPIGKGFMADVSVTLPLI